MSARIQITIDPELQRRAQAKAAELGLSFAEYVRRLLAHDLGEPKRTADISFLFDIGASRDSTDIARNKHQMIGKAVWREHLRKGPAHDRRPRAPARPFRNGTLLSIFVDTAVWSGATNLSALYRYKLKSAPGDRDQRASRRN